MSGKYAEIINEVGFVIPAFAGATWEAYANTGPVCDSLSYY